MKTRSIVRAAGLLVLCALVASPATAALATRTWVSAVGDDLNPCTRTAPCKTFAGALTKTAAAGEIDALDPAQYGSVAIMQSVILDGAGMAKIQAPASGSGVVIQAGSGDTVMLRNLSIDAAAGSDFGIFVQSARNVAVEH